MFDLTGKKALVTGASKGIGREIALRLAEAGADLMIWGRDKDGLEETVELVKRYGTKVWIDEFDITDRDAVERAAINAVSCLNRVDTLVVNAGINELKSFLDQDIDYWDRMIRTNLYGSLYTLHSLGRYMTKQGSGSVITTSSIYSFVGAPSNTVYCLTKGGLLQLTKALAVEWSRYNVRVNAICPGWIETDLTRPYMQDEKSIAAGLRQIPLRRFGLPSDIAPMAVYLASDESQWITGQSFVIDGGQIAR